MLKVKEVSIIYVIGAVGYSLLEIIWRGYTHWSMTITGGLCFSIIYLYNKHNKKHNLFSKCFIGALIITTIEFVVGCIVNIALGLNVWDYSRLHLNILGQISLLFCGLWFLLCFPVLYLCNYLQRKICSKLQPKKANSY